MTIGEVVEFLDKAAPFRTAESFDNVGLLVGGRETEVTGICCCLDITRKVIKEAHEKGANLIISHHPVIFGGLKNIPNWSPVRALIEKNIAAIAIHTNFDIAEGGVNDTLLELLGFEKSEVLEVTQSDGSGFGAICDMSFGFTSKTLAEYCRKALYLDCVKYLKTERAISRIAVSRGAGIDGKVMELAREKRVDAIISGDIKHNFWIEAENCGIALVDAGHYGTEKAASHRIAAIVTKKFPQVAVFSSEAEEDPCGYSYED